MKPQINILAPNKSPSIQSKFGVSEVRYETAIIMTVTYDFILYFGLPIIGIVQLNRRKERVLKKIKTRS